ncbi:hypothetical protein EDB89DRAFT_1908317 [Lactarius sanguifluus]|nr:hypothetical protein EDB89DRAFT_1908317 [Lactarius sanguifluus]
MSRVRAQRRKDMMPFDALRTNEYWGDRSLGPTRGSSSDRAVSARAWCRQRPELVPMPWREERHTASIEVPVAKLRHAVHDEKKKVLFWDIDSHRSASALASAPKVAVALKLMSDTGNDYEPPTTLQYSSTARPAGKARRDRRAPLAVCVVNRDEAMSPNGVSHPHYRLPEAGLALTAQVTVVPIWELVHVVQDTITTAREDGRPAIRVVGTLALYSTVLDKRESLYPDKRSCVMVWWCTYIEKRKPKEYSCMFESNLNCSVVSNCPGIPSFLTNGLNVLNSQLTTTPRRVILHFLFALSRHFDSDTWAPQQLKCCWKSPQEIKENTGPSCNNRHSSGLVPSGNI